MRPLNEVVSRRDVFRFVAGAGTAASLALLGCGTQSSPKISSVEDAQKGTKPNQATAQATPQESFPSEFKAFNSTYFKFRTAVPIDSMYSHDVNSVKLLAASSPLDKEVKDIFDFKDQDGPASIQFYPGHLDNPSATVADWAERELSEIRKIDPKVKLLSPSDDYFTSFSTGARPVMEIANKALQDIAKIRMAGKDTRVAISYTKVRLDPTYTNPFTILTLTAFTVANGSAWRIKFVAVDNLLVYQWKMSPMEVAMKQFHLI